MSTIRFLGIAIICLLQLANLTEQKSLPASTSTQCHPSPNANSAQYIVGYGSLMQTASKSRTYPNTGESVPVTINGFSRRWNAQGESIGFSTTFLGIEADSSASFNGIIFQLPTNGDVQATLTSYDDRETWYCREKVPFNKVKFFDSSKTTDANGEYWIYVNKPEFTAKPNKVYPIVQSYVDIFVSGCLEIEEKYSLAGFTAACIDSTDGWNKHWVNDRIYPRRPFLYEPKASKIDKVLAERVPKAYGAIEIEG